jgi:uncharacterized protein YjbI with pentapeptide repeats
MKIPKNKNSNSLRDSKDDPATIEPSRILSFQKIGKYVVWLGSFWVGAYGYFFQIYDSSKNRVENRATIVITQNLIGRAAATQVSEQMKEPMWYFPFTAFWKERNEDVVLQIRAYLEGKKLELTGVNLSGASLDSSNLAQGNLNQTKLENTTFVGADLTGADLSYSDLLKTNFRGAKLESVNFHKSKVDWSALSKENIRGAIFFEDTIQNVEFTKTSLDLCHFERCVFINVRFDSTSLEQSYLIGSKFINSSFKNCNLANANLRQVKLDHTDLENTNFGGAYRDSVDAEIIGWSKDQEFRLNQVKP